jgi:hypothetical protein
MLLNYIKKIPENNFFLASNARKNASHVLNFSIPPKKQKTTASREHEGRGWSFVFFACKNFGGSLYLQVRAVR